MLRIKKEDRVMVMTGRDKGKVGRVIKVFPNEQRLLVEKINLVKKAQRRTRQDQQGGLIELEATIHWSNVMLVDKKTNKPTRFGVSVLKDGSKVRMSKISKEDV